MNGFYYVSTYIADQIRDLLGMESDTATVTTRTLSGDQAGQTAIKVTEGNREPWLWAIIALLVGALIALAVKGRG
ncbi:hypothetical protein [Kordiimonas gwangyangensis]|uniref:hypothetical protein n=1 Tax=Kordiimonas gwangyangensis TaxID=288022 RepID=UPI0003624530|nr:hypothetical protein [Kordiimonas gwangyangensis]